MWTIVHRFGRSVLFLNFVCVCVRASVCVCVCMSVCVCIFVYIKSVYISN